MEYTDKKHFYRIRYEGASSSARFSAAILDYFYVLAFTGLIFFLATPFFKKVIPADFHNWEKVVLFGFIVMFIHHFFYAPFLDSTGKTPGKAAMNIKILHFEERVPPTYLQNLYRGLLRFLFATPVLIGILTREKSVIIGGIVLMLLPYLWHLFDRERQTIIDIWANVVVVERISEPILKDTKSFLEDEEIDSIEMLKKAREKEEIIQERDY